MPLGSDNFYIPIEQSNIGSIISYVLGSNIYKEAMIKSNYMESQSKIKIPTKHRVNVTETPVMGGGSDNIRQSVAGGNSVLTMTPSVSTNMGSNMADDTIKLYGKDDIFNFELSPH
jgi:hypothetical protein